MLTLMNGRPETNDGRLEKEIKCYDLLDRLGIPYQRLDHWPADSMEVCTEIDKSLNAVICKNLFLSNRQETDFYLLLIPGNMLIHSIAGTNSVTAVLPPKAALILIALATLLTILGGLIPARSAAKCNPVTALRSE